MSTNQNTKACVGVRLSFRPNDVGSGEIQRCYEPKGGSLYRSNRVNLEYKGTLYQPTSTIPFDQNGTAYSDDPLMESYFNSGWLLPPFSVSIDF